MTDKKIVLAVAICLGALVVIYLLKQAPDAPSVVVYTSVDQVFSEPVLQRFGKETGIRVRAVYDTEETKSTGILNRLIAEANDPQADVFWSGDPVRPFVLIDRGLVYSYVSPQSQRIPARFKATDGTWTGFAARARVLLVNRERLGDRPMPHSVRDLADPRWRGETAIANPVFGTTTMHVAAWFSSWGQEAAKAFLDSLKANKVTLASSNGEVKRLVVSGEVTFGLTDTDDAFVAVQSGAPVEVVYPDQEEMGALIMPTVVVGIRRGPNPQHGRRLIDYLLSAEVESQLSESAAHMPLNPDARHPDHIRAVQELQSMNIDYAKVAKWMDDIQPLLREWVGL
ncbi:MAG: extracellular solute-binding protein [Proteobacteria bacterium]|nr:extracellular solute-binding protein [Pseudomonadota bacterium]